MSRRSGFGANAWEKRGICFQLGALRTVPEYPKTLLFSQRRLGSSCPRTHLQGQACPPSAPPVLRTGPRSSDRHSISPPTTPAPAAASRARASPEPLHAAVRAPRPRATQWRRRAAGRPHGQDAYYDANLRSMSTLGADVETQQPTRVRGRPARPVPSRPSPRPRARRPSVPVLRDADDALLLGNDHGHVHHLLGPLDALQQDRLAG